MPNALDYLAQPPLFLILAMGPPNSGKSDLAMTFPACYVGSFDPGGFQILKNESERAQRLAKNLRYIENFNARGDSEMRRLYARTKGALKPEEIKPGKPQTFVPMDASDRSYNLMGWLAHIEETAQAKEIQTVVLDGFNYLVDQNEVLCRNDSKNMVTRTYDGVSRQVLDGRAAYMDLKNYLSQFMWSELLALCVRYHLNLIVTCHIIRLTEEAIGGVEEVKDNSGKTVRAATPGRVQQNSEIAAQITGKFKEAIEGKFANVLITEHVLVKRGVGIAAKKESAFRVYCDKAETETLGEVNAKNKHGLPACLDVTGKSFYEELLARTGGLPLAQPVSAPGKVGIGVKAK
jgi:hypothetical protein